jgi:hypothetical protein
MSSQKRFFPKLPNQVTEPDTNEHVSTPQPTSYPSFPSLSTLVSSTESTHSFPQPSPPSISFPQPSPPSISFPQPSPPSLLLFSHPPTPFPVITRYSTNESPVLCKELHITIPHAIPSPHDKIVTKTDTSIKYALPESSPHFPSTNKCCFHSSP